MAYSLIGSDSISRTWGLDSFGISSEATPTDWAILCGAGIAKNGYGSYWLKDRADLGVRTVTNEGNSVGLRESEKKLAGIRPFLSAADAQKIMGSAKNVGGNIYEYGEYPQSVEDDEATLDELDAYYTTLQETGETYTSNDPDERFFSAVQHPVYEYAGRKYVRIQADVSTSYRDNTGTLSDGNRAEQGKTYWVLVEPVRWVAAKDGSMIAEKTLIGGIPFAQRQEDKFENSLVKDFLDQHFEKDLTQSLGKTVQKEDKAKKLREEAKKALEKEKMKERKEEMQEDVTMDELELVAEPDGEVEELIAFYLGTGKSILLHGLPGVGKTARVRAVDPQLVSLSIPDGVLPEDVLGRTVYSDEKQIAELREIKNAIIGKTSDKKDDLELERDKNGNPQLVEKIPGGEWLAPAWYNAICEVAKDGKQHILFIDELMNARETTQGLIHNLIQEREIAPNRGKLPDNVTIVCAGNETFDSDGAYNMTQPLHGRFRHLLIPLSIDTFLDYAWLDDPVPHKGKDGKEIKFNCRVHNVHPLVAAFVAIDPDNRLFKVYKQDQNDWTKEEMKNPLKVIDLSPRRWKMLSDDFYCAQGHFTPGMIMANIGPDLGAQFMDYIKKNPVTVTHILKGTESRCSKPANQMEAIALVNSCVYVKEGEEEEKVRAYINSLRGKINVTECMDVFNKKRAVVFGKAKRSRDAANKNIRDIYKNGGR